MTVGQLAVGLPGDHVHHGRVRARASSPLRSASAQPRTTGSAIISGLLATTSLIVPMPSEWSVITIQSSGRLSFTGRRCWTSPRRRARGGRLLPGVVISAVHAGVDRPTGVHVGVAEIGARRIRGVRDLLHRRQWFGLRRFGIGRRLARGEQQHEGQQPGALAWVWSPAERDLYPTLHGPANGVRHVTPWIEEKRTRCFRIEILRVQWRDARGLFSRTRDASVLNNGHSSRRPRPCHAATSLRTRPSRSGRRRTSRRRRRRRGVPPKPPSASRGRR